MCAPLVARLVLAQRVEGDVARGEVAGRRALEVSDEAGARARDADRARMHDQVESLGPDQLAAHQTDRVGAHRANRADGHDPATHCRHRELAARSRAPRRRLGTASSARPVPIGISSFDPDDPRARRVASPSTCADRRLPDDDPAVRKRQRHAIRRCVRSGTAWRPRRERPPPSRRRPARSSRARTRATNETGMSASMHPAERGDHRSSIRAVARAIARPTSPPTRTTNTTMSASTPVRLPTSRVRAFVSPAVPVAVAESPGCGGGSAGVADRHTACRSLGRRGLEQQLRDDARRRHPVELGLRVEHEAVGEHRLGERLDVVRDHVVPAARRRQGLRAADQGEGAAHAHAEAHLGGRRGSRRRAGTRSR